MMGAGLSLSCDSGLQRVLRSSAANQKNHHDNDKKEADRTSADVVEVGENG
jgi:hypothetical protein